MLLGAAACGGAAPATTLAYELLIDEPRSMPLIRDFFLNGRDPRRCRAQLARCGPNMYVYIRVQGFSGS